MMRSSLNLLGFSLALAGHLLAQQTDAETQRASLTGLGKFAVYARVQLSDSATLPAIDESLLRAKLEAALKREGISLVERNDVRDGSGAHLSLLYLVLDTRDRTGQSIRFAASSCIQVAQTVNIPRLTTAKYIAYTVVPTWRSCGLLVGDSDSYRNTILQNADQQLARFLESWRGVNRPGPAPPPPATPELGIGLGSSGTPRPERIE
jgi:hypothetical protein